jgi:TRAP-type transport system periplasmic protein
MPLLMNRKQFLLGAAAAGAAATGAAAVGARAAHAAKHAIIKFGIDLPPDHPTTRSVIAAGDEIKAKTGGAVELQVFPANQLGDDTHMLSNLRVGAMQMMGIGDNILATLVPNAAIDNVGFAFKDANTAWTALDGSVGEMVRADIRKAGLEPMPRIWDEGFREITTSSKPINTPDDLHGFKIRVPPSPISLDLFRGLGAAPATLNVSELYTALQTKVVDGQENPLGVIETQKFYQVQKYCSLTNHMWVGYWMLMNGTFWKSLGAAHQKVVAAAFDAQALKQRVANNQLNNSLQAKLTQQGLAFNTPDIAPFRAALVKSGFYKNWQGKFGPALWAALEKHTGPLA